jgi:hypothetical protein
LLLPIEAETSVDGKLWCASCDVRSQEKGLPGRRKETMNALTVNDELKGRGF